MLALLTGLIGAVFGVALRAMWEWHRDRRAQGRRARRVIEATVHELNAVHDVVEFDRRQAEEDVALTSQTEPLWIITPFVPIPTGVHMLIHSEPAAAALVDADLIAKLFSLSNRSAHMNEMFASLERFQAMPRTNLAEGVRERASWLATALTETDGQVREATERLTALLAAGHEAGTRRNAA